MDHPQDSPDYSELFPEAVQALQEAYYRENKKIIEDVRDNMMRHGTDDLNDLEDGLRRRIVETMETLVEKYDYCEQCAKEAVSFVSRR